jgi:hypothetical protein
MKKGQWNIPLAPTFKPSDFGLVAQQIVDTGLGAGLFIHAFHDHRAV